MNKANKIKYNKITKRIVNGFTLIELLIVVVIIGILATIGIASFAGIQIDARNSQRSSKLTVVAEALEKYYEKNGEYPSCDDLKADPSIITTNLLKGLDPDALTAPSGVKGTNSFTLCNIDPTSDVYAYYGGGGEFILKYKEEGTGAIIPLNSRRQPATASLTLIAGTGGTVSGDGTYDRGSDQTMTATASTYYTFTSWTGDTGCAGVASHSITIDSNKSCTANFTATPIAAPAAPVVTANTVGATTTWSWPVVSCPGNSVRYQYQYSYSPPLYESALTASASTSVNFTTSPENITYTVAVQAECYNAATASGMGAVGSDSYYRPYSLTLTAGSGGTVSGAGLYNAGTTPTITATPSSGYLFSSWTGSTGCSGIASHNITMDGTKSCTANFISNTYTLTLAAGAGGTVSGGGTYNSGTAVTMTASASTYYSFNSWTGDTGCAGIASHSITMDGNKSCTASFTPTAIAAPAAPSVSVSTPSSTSTWSWPAVSCPGNSVRYQYNYTTSYGYNSGWVATASNSVAFTTSGEGYTYIVAVQAQCYNAVATSSWSASGSASYYRPVSIVYYTLTLAAGAGGTVSGGGTYNSGTAVTMTASASSGYSFSSWSGSTGCSGSYSHTITIDANKSCTASFTINQLNVYKSNNTTLLGPYLGLSGGNVIYQSASGPVTLTGCNNADFIDHGYIYFGANYSGTVMMPAAGCYKFNATRYQTYGSPTPWVCYISSWGTSGCPYPPEIVGYNMYCNNGAGCLPATQIVPICGDYKCIVR